MRNLMKRRRAQSFFVKLCLAVFAVGAIAAYGKFGSVRGAYDAITGYLFPEDVMFTVAESAPPILEEDEEGLKTGVSFISHALNVQRKGKIPFPAVMRQSALIGTDNEHHLCGAFVVDDGTRCKTAAVLIYDGIAMNI